MRTFWQDHHRITHHWYEENGVVYSVLKDGFVMLCALSPSEMNRLVNGGQVQVIDLPEKIAKSLPNNFARSTQ